LPQGVFPELLENQESWSTLLGKAQGSLKPGEDRSDAFDRLLGKLVLSSNAIEILDPYLTCPLLANALTESNENLFWLDKLLGSNASKLILFSLHPRDKLLSMSAQCRGNSRLSQVVDEQERLQLILGYLVRQKEKYGFKGSIEFRSALQMPHDRYLRFGLINGSVYVGLPKGIDPFEKNPLESVHKFFNLDKNDWKHVMDSAEWGPRDRTVSDDWTELLRHTATDGSLVTVWKQRIYRSQFTGTSTRQR
jgi:hypothetical protein